MFVVGETETSEDLEWFDLEWFDLEWFEGLEDAYPAMQTVGSVGAGVAGIPAGLDEMVPGPVLAAFLSAIDVDSVSGHDRIVVLRAHQRMASHYQAHVYGDMAAVADTLETDFPDDAELAYRAAAAEIRVALRLTRRAADSALDLAQDLKLRLPRLFDALLSGDLDIRRAKTMVYGTAHLPPDTARSVVDQVIERAPGLTTGQLGARIRTLCIETDPNEAQNRYQHASNERRVVASMTEAATANLAAYDLPPDRVAAAMARIHHLAQSLNTRHESRTMDQLRADVFLDLLDGSMLGKAGRSTGGGVEIRVDLTTLAGLRNAAGELGGFGPVIADIARQTTHQQTSAQWRFTVTHPDTEQPVAWGITRRRPTKTLWREVIAHQPTCISPGCRMPATNSDLDHRIEYSKGGPTTAANLGPQCRHHHWIRHAAGWTWKPIAGGDHQHTTHLGHTYTTSGLPPPSRSP